MMNNNDDFLAKCKRLDPSIEIDHQANLQVIKNRLLNEEEKTTMFKNRKAFRPTFAAAILIGILSLSGVAYAASSWIRLDTRITQGEEYVVDFSAYADADGGFMMMHLELDPDASGPIVGEIDGEEIVLLDAHDYDDLDAALARLAQNLDNPMMPAYLPDGFSFLEATYHANVTALNILFGLDGQTIMVRISHYPQEWGIPQWSATFEEVTVNGYAGKIGGGSLWLQVGDTSYFFNGYRADLDYDHLIKIAESLF